MQQVKVRRKLKVRRALTAGVISSVFTIGFATYRSSDHLYAFVATTVVCSVVLLVAAVVSRLTGRFGAPVVELATWRTRVIDGA
jgi:hypothetical protein